MKQNIKTFISTLIIVGLVTAVSAEWNNPEENPTGGNTPTPINVGADSQTKAGSLWTMGFGTDASGYFGTTLSVVDVTDPSTLGLVGLFGGKIGATEYCDTDGDPCFTATEVDSLQTTTSSVPSGAVMAFDLASCPSGWTELTDARGRYIVGMPSGGTRGASSVTGTALTNMENRATGRHRHWIEVTAVGMTGQSSNPSVYPYANGTTNKYTTYEGTVDGTNAPYIQYLMCKKS